MSKIYAVEDIETGEKVLYYRTRKKLMEHLDPTEENVRYVVKSYNNYKEMGIPKPRRIYYKEDEELPF